MNRKELQQSLSEIAAQEIPDGLNMWPFIYADFEKKNRLNRRVMLAPKKIVRATVFMIVLFGLLWLVSPAVRAQINLQTDKLRKQIGDMVFFESDHLEHSPSMQTENSADNGLPWETMTVAEAQTRIGYNFKMPAWMPQDYIFDGEVHLWMLGTQPSVFMYWTNQHGEPWDRIMLTVEKAAVMGMQVGPGGAQEVIVNGKPATYIQGSWNENGEWEESGSMATLMWNDDNWKYSLNAGDHIKLETLLRIAASLEE